jgi:hypothetical protein
MSGACPDERKGGSKQSFQQKTLPAFDFLLYPRAFEAKFLQPPLNFRATHK